MVAYSNAATSRKTPTTPQATFGNHPNQVASKANAPVNAAPRRALRIRTRD